MLQSNLAAPNGGSKYVCEWNSGLGTVAFKYLPCRHFKQQLSNFKFKLHFEIRIQT